MDNITFAVLSNGIRVVMQPISHIRSVAIGVWVKAGSEFETDKNNGISHFTEHMMFKGTTTRDARAVAAAIDDVGGTLNAFTSKECTCYYVHVLDEHRKLGAELLGDMLCNSIFADIEKERGVVCEEIAMVEDTPDDLVHELAAQGYFGSHPLGMTILGPSENVRAFTADSVRGYMARRYLAGNIVLSVAGHFDCNEMTELLEKSFNTVPKGKTQDAAVSVQPVSQRVAVSVKDNEQMNLCLTFDGVGSTDKDYFAMQVFNAAFGGSMSSRLFQTVREKNGLTYSVYSYPSAYSTCGSFSVYAGMNPSQLDKTLKLIGQELQRARREGVTGTELYNAREQVKGGLILGLESAQAIMSRNGKLLLLRDAIPDTEEVLNCINGVTEEDIFNLTNSIITQNFCCALVGKKQFMPKEVTLY